MLHIQNTNADFYLGRFLDRNYRQTAEKLPSVQRDAPDFPIERTRLKGIYVLVTISALGTLGYGLALMSEAVRTKVGEKGHSELIFHQTAHLGHADHAVPDRSDNL